MSIRSLSQQSPLVSPPHLLILALTLVLGLTAPLVLNPLGGPVATAEPAVDAHFGHLPLSFIPNMGQANPTVRYQVRGAGGVVSFTDDEVVLSLPGIDTHARIDAAGPAAAVVRMRFEGTSTPPVVSGGEPLPGVVNYVIGNDAANWRTGLPMFGTIVYHQLYPGIDLHYDGTGGQLKGTYTVAPGADPTRIRWSHTGAANVRVDASTGDLIITLPADTARIHDSQPYIVEEAPRAWQDIDGRRIPVAVRYALGDNGRVGFALGSYDPSHPLTIDPTLVYSTYLGGNTLDDVAGIAVDSAGNAYVAGTTSSTNFPGSPIRPYAGGDDVFVAKINAAGTALSYITYLGGNRDGPDSDDVGDGDDDANDIAVDSAGNVYITGETDAIDFPTTPGSIQPQSSRIYDSDAFVVKLNANGTLSYGTYLGGSSYDEGEGIAVDSAGNAYVTGYTDSSDFPTERPLRAKSGLTDAFVAKLNASGSALEYGTYLGGSAIDIGFAIAVDASNNAYIIGNTLSTNFPTANAYQADKAGGNDVFVTKLNAGGTNLVYSTYLGGSGTDTSYDIAVDGSGSAYVTGETQSGNFPTFNALQSRNRGSRDAFVARLNARGNDLLYSTYLGGNGEDYGYGIAVNSAGEAYVTGTTNSTNFPSESPLRDYSGNNDTFVTKLSADGKTPLYSTYLGGSSFDASESIALDNAGNAYITGITGSSNFPLENPLQPDYRGNSDAFVLKLGDSAGGTPPPPPVNTPTTGPTPTRIPDASPIPDPAPAPIPAPRLLGSYKLPSKVLLLPGENLTYSIVLYNNGTAEATVDVTDPLPPELDYVPGTASEGGEYDEATRTLTWRGVRVAPGSSVTLSYEVTRAVIVRIPTAVVNTSTIRVGDSSFKCVALIMLMPGSTPDDLLDVIPPTVQQVRIADRDVLDERSTTLSIVASDDGDISEMYLREWYLETTAFPPRWQVVQSSGWVSYAEEYPWELGPASGTHFVGVWVKDSAGNISLLNPLAIDFASLIGSETDLPRGRAMLYLVSYQADEEVEAILDTVSGDADLYVWYPGSFLAPDHASIEMGTDRDEVSFTTPRAGTYVFVVFGYAESRFNLSISPQGGARAAAAAAPANGGDSEPVAPRSSKAPPDIASLLTQTGLDPLGSATARAPGSGAIYLPVVAR